MTYIAQTIGPITETFSNVRRVRHLWGASYLFSHFMEEIFQCVSKDAHFDIILPAKKENILPNLGVGLYADRIYLRITGNKEEAILSFQNHIKNVKEALNQQIGTKYKGIEDYLQTYFVVAEIPSGKNVISQLNHLLDNVELQGKFGKQEDFNLNGSIDKLNRSWFYQKSFGRKIRFETLTEISAYDLVQSENFINGYHSMLSDSEKKSIDEIDFFEYYRQNGSYTDGDFRQYHKYMALVHADGDNIGSVISEIEDNETKLHAFSKLLFSFASKASEIINKQGGLPIYAGGDDLLFLAPICLNTNGIKYTIFDLCIKLNDLFIEEVKNKMDIIHPENQLSLSFGVNITYHKFPLGEGLEESRNLLFQNAKSFIGKNALALRIQKHSGHTFNATLPMALLSKLDLISSANENFDAKQLSSVMYVLKNHEELLETILNSSNIQIHIDSFFENQFNESIHKKHPFSDFLSNVKKFLIEAKKTIDTKETILTTYALLRFFHLINAKFSEDE